MKELTNFANGLNIFCTECNSFFSVKEGPEGDQCVQFCPFCGCDELIFDIDEFLEYLADSDTDPINFYKAFPLDELIPNSGTGATPRQVDFIVGCVMDDKQKKLPVTVESYAAQLGYDKEIIRKVFEELHITETRDTLIGKGETK